MEQSDASYEHAVSLFVALAKIRRLLHEAELGTSDDAKFHLLEACKLVEHHTLDIRLRNEVTGKLNGSQLPIGDESWKLEALNTYNAALTRARESENIVFSGTLYVQRGLYNEAFMMYAQCKQADELVSHVHVLQRNWPYIITRFNHQFAQNKIQFNNEVLLNVALANWSMGEYRDCLAVLLRLKLREYPRHDVWLSHEEIKGMLVVCALLVFDQETLDFFLTADRLAQHFEVKKIIKDFYNCNVNEFWTRFNNDLNLPWICPTEPPRALIRDKLLKNWLCIYNKVPLALVLEFFGLSNSEFPELNLLEDLKRWNAPYKIDFMNSIVFYKESPKDTARLAEKLAWEFKRDSLLLLWNKITIQ